MPKGGARVKSGPTKDPSSARSERAGFKATALPNEGYAGRPPGLNQFIPKPTARHRQLWEQLWGTPQACMWTRESYKWSMVARLALLRAKGEGDCPASIYGEIIKLETKLGLNDEGMRYLGWAIAQDQVAAKAEEKTQEPAEPVIHERRLRSVDAQS